MKLHLVSDKTHLNGRMELQIDMFNTIYIYVHAEKMRYTSELFVLFGGQPHGKWKKIVRSGEADIADVEAVQRVLVKLI